MIRACIDTNVWISGILFSGPPSKIVDLALKKRFELVLSRFILEELECHLLRKFEVQPKVVSQLIYRIAQSSDLYEPKRIFQVIQEKHNDNLILETAWLGKAKFLVTGDKKHLLPLDFFKGTKIIFPKEFLDILKK